MKILVFNPVAFKRFLHPVTNINERFTFVNIQQLASLNTFIVKKFP